MLLTMSISLFGQSKIKEVINKKITNVKSKINDDSLRITGAVKIYAGYRIFSENNSKPFEYRINANVNLSYKGIKIPLAYNFSNGKSLYRINGPNLNVPKFNNLGFSPTYKWAKLHVGTRTMSFSKYSYDNLRFVGGGTELTPGNLQFKFFNGKIFQSSLSDIQLSNSLNNPFKRKAWGMMSGYKSKTAEYSGILFKSSDDYSGITDSTVYKIYKPKANTIVGIVAKQTIFEHLELSYDWTISALTYNLFSERIDIPTHWTAYNMFGLYEKRTSSKYANAKKLSIKYSKDDKTYGFNYERIDKDYRSLGSLIFDNNYESYTVTFNQQYFKKLNTTSEIGIRRDGIAQESSLTGKRWVANINVGYTVNDRLSFNSNYSNFRNVERNYFQPLNSIAFDSVSISLVNQNFNISSNYALDKNKKTLLTLMYSMQISNRIQSDSVVSNNQLNNHIYTANYSYTNKKVNISSAISYMFNKSEQFTTKAIIPNFSVSVTISEKLAFRSTTTYNHMMTDVNLLRSLSLNQDLNYQINKKQNVIFTNRWNFNTSKNRFKLLENMVELDYSLKF
ncbi:MAG: hypothetical protein KA536_06405 [Saprospiraceae bacterium]|nr:hypothetical protein [Saprospiraceae bacterium]